MSAFKPITVTQFSTYIKQIFDAEELIHGISIVGEISGWSNVRGTAYFTLKDESSALSCVCFVADKFSEFKNGDSVMIIGSARYYTKTGKLNFNVSKIEHYGENILYQKFLELKSKLEQQGYFAEKHKKEMPKNIKRIGVVTSEGGAVIQDIINVRTRRNPGIDIVLYPVKVQGTGAEKEISAGINFLDNYNVDVIVVARGGGSFEDLQPFNTEEVANATYNCNKPIVSAVGHETDFTIIDFCSDLRVPTPSAAAEVLCEDVGVRKYNFKKNVANFFNLCARFCEKAEETLKKSAKSITNNFGYLYENARLNLNKNINVFSLQGKVFIDKNNATVYNLCELLNKLNPENVLKLGYACLKNNNKNVTSINDVNVGDDLNIKLKDGELVAKVTSVEENIWIMKN